MEPTTPPPNESRGQSQSYTPPAPPSSSAARLWRPAAQKNLRNQWSKLNSLRQDWNSAASAGRSYATAIVNAYLSQKYMDSTDFGALSDLPNIRKKACSKLFKQQVVVVTRMVDVCKSMRCYLRKTSNSQLTQFSLSLEDDGDSGDCGGIPVFVFHTIASFEELAWEIVRMFTSELNLKRLLVLELSSISSDKVDDYTGLQWYDEFYDGELNDLSILNLYSKVTSEPVVPCLRNGNSGTLVQSKKVPDSNGLQVYIATWMVEVNIDRSRCRNACRLYGNIQLMVGTLDKMAKSPSSLVEQICIQVKKLVTERLKQPSAHPLFVDLQYLISSCRSRTRICPFRNCRCHHAGYGTSLTRSDGC
ncbi:uncharacterized protein LOC127255246 isoform X2 [Andrographis paniculata]|uniref:uncharacterized protein LOC127255246 isoform X2 n=1 Tax=Andrographis paniculata TaxID=175694 RepID=UPI0021E9601A|nr:uncharacterized protein LOC127255246 isoform X2 [Andrographis paniculata]